MEFRWSGFDKILTGLVWVRPTGHNSLRALKLKYYIFTAPSKIFELLFCHPVPAKMQVCLKKEQNQNIACKFFKYDFQTPFIVSSTGRKTKQGIGFKTAVVIHYVVLAVYLTFQLGRPN